MDGTWFDFKEAKKLWHEDEMLLHDPDAERLPAAWRRLFGEDVPKPFGDRVDLGDASATPYSLGRWVVHDYGSTDSIWHMHSSASPGTIYQLCFAGCCFACTACSLKPGAPTYCDGCLRRRAACPASAALELKRREEARAAAARMGVAAEPIDMVLHCPRCRLQHVDAADPAAGWANPPHRSHLCAACGHVWRPADVCTNGVRSVRTRGEHDSPALPAVVQLEPGVVGVKRRRFEVFKLDAGDGRLLLVQGRGKGNVVNGWWTLDVDAYGHGRGADGARATLVGYVEDQRAGQAFARGDSDLLLEFFKEEMAKRDRSPRPAPCLPEREQFDPSPRDGVRAGMVHVLKTWPESFWAVVRGDKMHEVRRADRPFAVGDVLRLMEWRPSDPGSCDWQRSGLPGTYTGWSMDADVTFMMQGQYGLPPDLAVMSVRPCGAPQPWRPAPQDDQDGG